MYVWRRVKKYVANSGRVAEISGRVLVVIQRVCLRQSVIMH